MLKLMLLPLFLLGRHILVGAFNIGAAYMFFKIVF